MALALASALCGEYYLPAGLASASVIVAYEGGKSCAKEKVFDDLTALPPLLLLGGLVACSMSWAGPFVLPIYGVYNLGKWCGGGAQVRE